MQRFDWFQIHAPNYESMWIFTRKIDFDRSYCMSSIICYFIVCARWIKFFEQFVLLTIFMNFFFHLLPLLRFFLHGLFLFVKSYTVSPEYMRSCCSTFEHYFYRWSKWKREKVHDTSTGMMWSKRDWDLIYTHIKSPEILQFRWRIAWIMHRVATIITE